MGTRLTIWTGRSTSSASSKRAIEARKRGCQTRSAADEALAGTPITHCNWLVLDNMVQRLARPLTCITVERTDRRSRRTYHADG